MISKELYEEVQKDYIDFKNITQDEYIIIFNKEEETVEYVNKHTWYEADSISIYKLAHKCKEWAFEFRFDNKPTNNRYYGQRSGYEDKFNVEKQKREKLGYMTLTFGCLGHTKTFYADTEPEAIFKACQWILENKTNKEG